MIDNRFEIIIITYNRIKYLKETCGKLLEENSPVKNYQITILDNNSTDGTGEYADLMAEKYSNVRHIKNKYNVGGNANFAKAVELAEKEYFWILGDDDTLNFEDWQEVEQAMDNNYDMIYLAVEQYNNQLEYIAREYPKFSKSKDWEIIKKGVLAANFILISSSIYKRSTVDDSVMRNAYDTVYTSCPQSALFCKILNENRPYYVLKNGSIVHWGGCEQGKDMSYTRGHSRSKMYPRTARMAFLAGVANALEMLKDKKLQEAMLEFCFRYTKCENDMKGILMSNLTRAEGYWFNITDLIITLPPRLKFVFLRMLILRLLHFGIFNLFNVKNIKDDNYMYISFLFFHFKIKRKGAK